jgi:MtrB/PioB family decaheme-associated outer membrane protein
MYPQVNFVRTCVLGIVLSGAGLFSTAAPAQTATAINSASKSNDGSVQASSPTSNAFAAADPIPYWWFHGTVEAGGRFFLNSPPRNGSAYLGQESLAKYYEYSTIKPGPFGSFAVSAGTRDGLYQVDAGGANLGYDDESFYLDVSKAGQHYFNFGWDQAPHLYSTSAQTFYQGVGTTNLTLPPSFAKPATAAAIPGAIDPFLYQTNLGIKRDTASAQYRWTPDDAWDIRADYSNMHRYGTQVDGVIMSGFGGGGRPFNVTVPRPVDDTTQNYGVNGEYAGTSPWGRRFTFKVAYNGSQYDDDFTSYTIADPFAGGSANPARLSTWPSNRADATSGVLGADLPWNSRYVGMLSYDMIRQNDAFIPMSTGAAFTLPQNSLDGKINTLLSNNIITTRLTPELTSKLSYRYYDFHNDTPEVHFANWISYDGTALNAAINSLSVAYTKQNAGADLNWRPDRAWNIGGGYGWERYDWSRADVNTTNENSGNAHIDWMPTKWFTVRSSGSYASRRYDNYDYYGHVCDFNYATDCSGGAGGLAASVGYSQAYRQFFLDNRDRWKANIGADIVVVSGLIVSPSFIYQDDHYGLDPRTEEGLEDSRSYSTGIDVTYLANRDTSITVGYMRDYLTQLVYNCSCGGHLDNAALPSPSTFVETTDRMTVDTFTALVRYAAIPDKLDLSLRYALSHGIDHQRLLLATGAEPAGGQFPDDTTWFQRLDAEWVYKFDKATVAQLGWRGDVKAKLHYAWERNSVANWQNDTVTPYNALFTGSGSAAIFMAYDTPNYNVHMLIASLAVTW